MDADYRSQITAGILAGGEARRMGGIDKGLFKLQGKPLISYSIDLIRPQVGEIIINTNRNTTAYCEFGYPLIGDNYPGHEGPLVGIAGCMASAKTAWIVCIPCDSPFLPDDLVERMYQKVQKDNAEICMAHDGEFTQPVFVLLKTSLLNSLHNFLANGERKPDKWYASHRLTTADFSDKPHSFININSQNDITRATDIILKMT